MHIDPLGSFTPVCCVLPASQWYRSSGNRQIVLRICAEWTSPSKTSITALIDL